LEDQLKDVKGMSRMTSWSSYSRGLVTMEFPVGTDVTRAMLELNSRINQLRDFPEDSYQPIVSSANLFNRPVCWYVLSPRVPSDAELQDLMHRHPDLVNICQPLLDAHKWDLRLYRLQTLSKKHPRLRTLLPITDVSKSLRFVEEHVKSRFDRGHGVAETFVLGGQAQEMQVVIDPVRLAARRVTIDDLRRVLRLRNKDSSGGVEKGKLIALRWINPARPVRWATTHCKWLCVVRSGRSGRGQAVHRREHLCGSQL
jgi:hydrophobic/amphiphilic exporter-1 (mainly G- bacteria), HAE1 family